MDSPARNYLPLRELNWRLIIAVIVLTHICFFFYRYLDFVSAGQKVSPLVPFIEEGSGLVGALLLFPVGYMIATRFPLLAGGWKRNLPVHLLAVLVLSASETTLMAVQRAALFPALGLGAYHYGDMSARYPMELSKFFIFYWVAIGAIYFFNEVRLTRARELEQAQLQSRLAEAQLANLRLQLEPHFLFNALNAISAAIYEDPRTADEMIGRLSELLRSLLKQDRSQEVPLAREIELLQLYARMMEARFEDRLKLSIDVGEGTREALVPQLILQPLVENAFRYGMDLSSFHFDIAVTAHREESRVVISVRDHGPGLEATASRKCGIGLANTRDRLQRLYGNEQSFTLRNAEGGGAIAELHIPLRSAE